MITAALWAATDEMESAEADMDAWRELELREVVVGKVPADADDDGTLLAKPDLP